MAVLPAHRSLEDFVELFERKGSWNPQLSPYKWFVVSRGDSEVNACGHSEGDGVRSSGSWLLPGQLHERGSGMPRWMMMVSSRSDVCDSTRVRRPATSEVQTVLGLENRGSFEGHRTVLARATVKVRAAWRSRKSDGRLRSENRIQSASQRHFDWRF